MKRLSLAAVVSLGILGACTTEARAGSVTLFDTVFNTDYVSSAIGLSGLSGGPITVTGISGPITQAVLFWRGPKSSGDPNVTFNGVALTGTDIGVGDDSGGGSNTSGYSSDVTPFVGGNGSYSLGGFPTGANGVDNAAALLVFFNDGNGGNNHNVVLVAGAGAGGGFQGLSLGPTGGNDDSTIIDLTSLLSPGPNGLGPTTNTGLEDPFVVDASADVAPIANPEPTTLLLVGGGLLLARRARRAV